MGKTIIISNRLPVTLQRKDQILTFRASEGGLATGLGSVYKEGDNLWVGWPGAFIDSDAEKEFIIEELQKESMYPVYLNKKEIRDYYEGFSNATLWPTFHYFNQYVVYNPVYWEAYKKVNQKFCEVVQDVIEKGDTIWVHDYQLLLLPQLLRQSMKECLIGFFQHIPFPSYEVFRLLPWRNDILEGMLGADLIGFHTYDDARHFLSSVNRIVGASDTNGQLDINNRYILVDAFPMGIDYHKYEQKALSEDSLQNEKAFRRSLGNQKLVLSIDRLDYSKGIPEKLLAFEKFLEKNPAMQGDISLVMIVVPSRHHVKRYKELKEEIDELSGRINSRFSTLQWRPIHYFYRSFPFDHLSALYHMADIALITPMRDGMNLVAKEYVASKTNSSGALILSEMAGASKELSDAIIINPNDIDAIVAALEQAIRMPVAEKKARMESMRNIVRQYDIHNWVELFLERLQFIADKQKSIVTTALNEEISKEMMQSYWYAARRLIFVDIDESLLIADTNQQRLNDDVFELFRAISNREQNKLVCISGADCVTMERWFRQLPVDLIAEHGMWLRKYGHSWQIFENISCDWKFEIFPVLEHFVKRTPGSFIEEKDFSLVWRYRKVEPGLGELRARELTEHLKYLVSNMNLNVLQESNRIEIKNSLINKGRAVRKWLDENYAEFIFVYGGSNSSEDIFKILPENAYSVKDDRSQTTHARFNIIRKEAIYDILRMMAPSKEYNLN